jgi:hypothetical protein
MSLKFAIRKQFRGHWATREPHCHEGTSFVFRCKGLHRPQDFGNTIRDFGPTARFGVLAVHYPRDLCRFDSVRSSPFCLEAQYSVFPMLEGLATAVPSGVAAPIAANSGSKENPLEVDEYLDFDDAVAN